MSSVYRRYTVRYRCVPSITVGDGSITVDYRRYIVDYRRYTVDILLITVSDDECVHGHVVIPRFSSIP